MSELRLTGEAKQHSATFAAYLAFFPNTNKAWLMAEIKAGRIEGDHRGVAQLDASIPGTIDEYYQAALRIPPPI